MRQLLCLTAIATSTLLAPAALAAEQPRTAAAPPNPAVAAGLSIGAPLLLTLGAVTITTLQYPVFGFLVPMGFGAGHVYAGDPGRGALVGLGGYAAPAAGGLLGYGVEKAVAGSGSPLNGLTGTMIGAGIALAAYGGWAAHDAYGTAERRAKP